MYLAETIGLLHDIRRFEQCSKYKTFKDTASEDHAVLGVSALKRLKVLEGVSEEEQEIIHKAIEYHNKLDLP